MQTKITSASRIFIFLDSNAARRAAEALRNFGYCVRHCLGYDDVSERGEFDTAIYCSLAGRAVLLVKQLVRENDEAAVVCVGFEQDMAVDLLAAGAHCWVPAVSDPSILCCLAQSFDRLLVRKRAMGSPVEANASVTPDGSLPGKSYPGIWRLSMQNVLSSPDGVAVSLSAGEARVITAFIRSKSHILLKGDRKFGGGHARAGLSVALTISRLRLKFRRLGVELPVRSLYGVGYRFHAAMTHDTAEDVSDADA